MPIIREAKKVYRPHPCPLPTMKIAQSRGDSDLAKVMTIVALMLMAATGAWAQTALFL